MRIWLVTAKDMADKFIDQRRIEAPSQAKAEEYAYDWIARVGGKGYKSTIIELEPGK